MSPERPDGGGLGLPRYFQPRTIPALLRRRAEQAPDAVAVVGDDGAGGDRTLSFAALLGASRRMAAVLIADHGLRSGDHVAWLAANEHAVDAFVLYHAVLACGAVNVPVNTRLSAPEVAHIAAHSEARLLVHAPGSGDHAADAIGRLDGDPPPAVALAALRAAEAGPAALAAVEDRVAGLAETDRANLLYTSGTTGRPKGAVHSHASSLAAGIGWADAFRLGPGDMLQSPFPVFSGAGLHFNGLSALWAGAANAVDGTDVGASLRRVERLGSTVFVAVPAIYHFWLDSPELSGCDLMSLRILDYGGATMAPAAIARLRAALPGVGLMQTYGLTEAGPGGLYLPEEYAVSRLGAIGTRGAGGFTEFRIVADDGGEADTDEVGELLLRGPSLMVGYHRDAAATEEAFVAGGWLRTGDLVRADSEGFVYHVDRRKDIIVRGGFNISSTEVESAVLEHPAVLEAAVVGRPHAKLGEDVEAVVVLRAGESAGAEEIVRHSRECLADFKVPRVVRFRDELPRNAAGKVLKAVLKEEAAAGAAPAA